MKPLFCLLFIILFHSCVDQGSSDVVFTMYNQTDKSVRVLGFNIQVAPNANGIADPIEIEPNSHFSVTRFTGLGSDLGKRFYSIMGVDSVRAVFNKEKVLILTLESTFKQGQTIFQGDENHQHFITEEDYESAVECDEDCE